MGISRIEDLDVWVLGMDIAVDAYSLTKTSPLNRDYGLSDQIRRSAVSIPANVAEGFGRYGEREFSRFVSIARGSWFELFTLLQIALRTDSCTSDSVEGIDQTIETEIRKLTALRTHLSKDG